MKKLINLQLFTDYTNVTTANTTGTNDLSYEMKTYYSDYLIDLADGELIHDQFGQKKPIPQGSGKKIEFRKFSQLPKLTSAISEGVTPEGQALDVTHVEATVSQYGGFVRVSDVLQMTSIDPVIVESLKLIGSQAGRTLDTITRDIITASSVVQRVGGGAARANIASANKLTVDELRKAVRTLKKQNAPKIDGSYVAIVHPDVAYDLMKDSEWINAHQYADPTAIYNGEIGKIAGVRVIETSEAKVFSGAGASSIDVYATMVLGANAYGVTEVTGGGLKTIIKQLGSAGTADPLDQRSTVGWKAMKVAEVLVPQYMVRIESSASA